MLPISEAEFSLDRVDLVISRYATKPYHELMHLLICELLSFFS